MKNKILQTIIYTCLVASTALISSNVNALCTAPLPACGTITQNTTLTADCKGPLNIHEINIVVDLGGFSICDPNNDNGSAGITMDLTSNVTVKNGTIENNGNDGIYIFGASDVLLKDLVIKDNERNGVRIDLASSIKLQNVRVENNFYEGIFVDRGADIFLDRVESKGHYDDKGILVTRSTEVAISGAEVVDNEFGGISLNHVGVKSAVLFSSISNNNGVGIELDSHVEKFRLLANNVSWNTGHGIFISTYSVKGLVALNSVYNNGIGSEIEVQVVSPGGYVDIYNPSNSCSSPNLFFANSFGTKHGCVR